MNSSDCYRVDKFKGGGSCVSPCRPRRIPVKRASLPPPRPSKNSSPLAPKSSCNRAPDSKSGIPDADYEAGDATIASDEDATIASCLKPYCACVGLCLQLLAPPIPSLVLAIAEPDGETAALQDIAQTGVSLFAMELMPRITRAQVMDVLSS